MIIFLYFIDILFIYKYKLPKIFIYRNLKCNKLTKIPEKIGELKNLSVL